jgi:hypothetical protein
MKENEQVFLAKMSVELKETAHSCLWTYVGSFLDRNSERFGINMDYALQ